jgi:hypothetical protein
MKDLNLTHENGDVTIKLTVSKIAPLYKVTVTQGIGVTLVKFIPNYIDAIRFYLTQIASELAVHSDDFNQFSAIENLVN